MRYRLGHLVKITSLRNELLDIDIPQMIFLTRVDDQIDIAGFTRLSEKVIWQAIENSGISYVDWTANKELEDAPVLNLYVELRDSRNITTHEISSLIHEELKKLDAPYSELESFTGLRPLKVTLLARNAFDAFRRRQQAAGAELEQLRPPHINPPKDVLDFLLDSAAQRAAAATPVPDQAEIEA